MSWKEVALIEIAAKKKYPIGDGDHGAIKPSQYQDFGIPYIRVADIDWNGEINEENMVYISEEVNNLNPKSYLYPGDIIISKTGATIGKVAIIPERFRIANTTASIGKVSIDTKIANTRYVFWAMKSSSFQTEMWKVSHKSAQPGFNVDDLKNFKIPLPPLATQKRIAEILDAADALRRKDQELLKKYDELAQAIFIDMFGDPVKNEKGWDVKTIDGLVKKGKHAIKRGPFGGALKKEIFVKEGYLVYEQFHALNDDFSFGRYFINEEKYKELIAFDVKPKDIIISCSGIYLGKLAIVPDYAKPGIINQALLKLSLDESIYKNEFFVTVFSKENFKEKYFASERGAAIPNFPPMSAFKEFKFICPPIEIQEEYINKLSLIKKQVELSLSSNSEILFNSLIQKAFKGELV